MVGIILAAGMGQRLGKLTESTTKGQLSFGNNSLIIRLLEQIKRTEVFEEVIIVVGYQKENLIDHINGSFQGLKVSFVANDIFDETNNIYSLYLAKHFLTASDCVIFESDLVLDEDIIKRFVSSDHQNSVMLAKYESWMDGTVVELGKNDKILKFISGKALEFERQSDYYKTVNVYKFSKDFSKNHYVPFLEAYITSFGKNSYYEEVLKIISFLEHTDLNGYILDSRESWYEIDDQHDLFNAEAVFGDPEERLDNLMSRYGGYWRFPEVVDFCYLVNPYYPGNQLIEELKGNFEELLRQYPSGHLVQSLLAARNFGVEKSNVIVGNGGTELIKAYAETIRSENSKKRIGIILPTFEEYWRQFDNEYFEIVPLKTEEPFNYNLEDILDFMSNIDTLILINPDNPSGNTLTNVELIKILDKSTQLNVSILVDESFIDFADDNSYFTLIEDKILGEYKNLHVLKSISKSYGVPGLRLGVLFSGNTNTLQDIREKLSIWNINSFAEFYLDVAYKYRKDYSESRLLISEARYDFMEMLKEVPWIKVFPSQANYVLCKLLTDNFNSRELTKILLSEHNILIKDCAPKLGFEGKSYVRIAVRDRSDNSKLVAALKMISKGILIG